MKKRWGIVLLALCMVLTLFPATALAKGELSGTASAESAYRDVAEPAEASYPVTDGADDFSEDASVMPEDAKLPEGVEETEANPPETSADSEPDTALMAGISGGRCGTNLMWSVDSSGVLSISGEGEMANYIAVFDDGNPGIAMHVYNPPWSLSSYPIQMLIIEDGVISIGSGAFRLCRGLTSVTIPDSVTSIGMRAFYNCNGLTSVTIPDSVTFIGREAFYGCGELTDVIIPDSVISIEYGAFYNCKNLTNIYYAGTAEQWNSIQGYSNVPSKATIHYNSAMPDNPASDPDSNSGVTLQFYQDSYTVIISYADVVTASVKNGASLRSSDFTWSSSDESVVQVLNPQFSLYKTSVSAVLRGVSPGTATITVSAKGKSASCAVTVIDNKTTYIPVTSLRFDANYQSIDVGEKKKFNVSSLPYAATNKTVTWSSSDSNIASVDVNGYVTGKSAGQVTITASCADGVSVSCNLTVPAVKSPTELLYEAYRSDGYFRYDYQGGFRNNGTVFGHSENDYKIPPERYTQAGFSQVRIKLLRLFPWNGNCFGMNFASILFFKNLLQEANYESGR